MFVTFVIRNAKTGAYLVSGVPGSDYWHSDINRATEFEVAADAETFRNKHRWLNEKTEIVAWY